VPGSIPKDRADGSQRGHNSGNGDSSKHSKLPVATLAALGLDRKPSEPTRADTIRRAQRGSRDRERICSPLIGVSNVLRFPVFPAPVVPTVPCSVPGNTPA
jgi:hypothetical protein